MRMLNVLLLVIWNSHCLADDPVEQVEFAKPPKYIQIDRRPERPLQYDVCLLQLKNGDEEDRLGVVSALPNKGCPSNSELNSHTPAEREAEKKLVRVYDSVEIEGGIDATAPMKGRKWKISKAGGFYRQIKNGTNKPLWDPFCVAKIITVDEGEEDDRLIVCNKKKVGEIPPGQPIPPFTCEGIASCIASMGTLKVEKPLRIGKETGESRNGGDSELGNTDGSNFGGASGRIHKTP